MHNVDVLTRQGVSVDKLDNVVVGNRKDIPCYYFYSKIGAISIEGVDVLKCAKYSLAMMC